MSQYDAERMICTILSIAGEMSPVMTDGLLLAETISGMARMLAIESPRSSKDPRHRSNNTEVHLHPFPFSLLLKFLGIPDSKPFVYYHGVKIIRNNDAELFKQAVVVRYADSTVEPWQMGVDGKLVKQEME